MRKKPRAINDVYEALASNCSLKTLIADGTRLDDQQTLALAAFIGQKNCRLEELHYSGFEGDMEYESLEALREATERNQSLLICHCTSAKTSSPFEAALTELATRNREALLAHTPLAMQSFAHKALNPTLKPEQTDPWPNVFDLDVTANILRYLDKDSQINLVRAAFN